MIYLTKVEHFNAAHKLSNSEWSKEKNIEFYGKCANPNFHGHNYILHVTVKGVACPETGFILNAQTLSRLIKELIIEKFDHKNLNMDIKELENKLTSVENVTITIWDILFEPIKNLGTTLHKIKLEETPTIFAEYFGKN